MAWIFHNFERSVYYSMEDYSCDIDCALKHFLDVTSSLDVKGKDGPEETKSCPSKMKKFYYKNGKYPRGRKIGYGGYGQVYSGKWHQQLAALKYVKINVEQYENEKGGNMKVVAGHEFIQKRLKEIKLPATLPESSNILKAIGHFRQITQNYIEQEDVGDGDYYTEWDNYEVFIYPLCSMNLEEFCDKHRPETTYLKYVMQECLKR